MKTARHHRPLINALAFGLLLFAAGPALADTGSGSASAPTDTRDYTLEVASAQGGNPVPGIGTHTNAWQATVTASVDAVAGDYTCTGWTGTGSVPPEGVTTNTGAIVLTNVASTIAWQWEAQGAADTDGDGLPDAWEIEHFGNLTASAGTGDFDRDGRTDAEEFADNTDPTNPGSTLGLVAYYPLDGNGTDLSPNNNSGAVYGAISAADRFDEANGCLRFDGIDDYIDCGNDTSVQLTGPMTISAWVSTENRDGVFTTAIVSKSGSPTTWPKYALTFGGNGQTSFYAFYTEGNTGSPMVIDGSPSIQTGIWYQVCVVLHGDGVNDAEIWVNGALDAQGTLPYPGNEPNPLSIGRWGNHSYFPGSIDDVRIYNRALSSNEVARLYSETAPDGDTDLDGLPDEWENEHFGNLTASDGTGDFDRDGRTDAEELADNTDPTDPGSTLGLVAYYPFDGNAEDATTNANNGTVHGASLSTDRFGNENSAYEFNGVSNYISVAGSSELNISGFISISGWIKASDTSVVRGIVDRGPGLASHGGYYVRIHNGKLDFAISMPYRESFGDTVSTMEWMFFAVTYNDSIVRIHQDDKLVYEGAIGSGGLDPWNDSEPLTIGVEAGNFFNGTIDDIRIYNRALSSNEVARLYAVTAPDADTDGDGLPDAWEIEHFGNLTASDGTGDFDRDGRTDAEELADNTDPTDPGSTLGLVLYYPMDGHANDMSGVGNHGTLVGALPTTNRFGLGNRAYRFTGMDYIEAQALPAVNSTGSFTYSTWILIETPNYHPSGGAWYIDRRPQGNGYPIVGMWSNDPTLLQWMIRYDNGTVPEGRDKLDSGQLHLGTWHHYAIVRDYGETVRTYEDGKLIASYVDDANSLTPDRTLLGNYVDTGHGLVGSMDEFRIYNRALSSNEVARLYAETASPPTTHLVTLHPGDHGDIPGANSGADYVTNVTHGAAFTPPTPDADAGWSFTGWNPPIPATITNDVTAMAEYEAVATSTYQLIEGSFTWHEAKADAEARGGHLACIMSQEEWDIVLNNVGTGMEGVAWWLGGYRDTQEGVWLWVTGETWGFANWADGQPDNRGGNQNFLRTFEGYPYQWDDLEDGIPFGYILEIPAGSPPPAPRTDLSLSDADFRILNAAGVETWNPAIGEPITLEVTLHNTGETNTTGDILVQAFLDGAPTDLASYDINAFSNVASTVVAESMSVGGSRTLLLPWTATGPDRVATLTIVAEFAANRTQSQANAEGASEPLPVAEVSLANNATGRPLQIGSPAAGDYGIEVLTTPPPNMQSGVSYTLAGTARYDWGANEPVLGATVTVTVGGQTNVTRTASPNGAWSVPINGLPAGNHPALVKVFDGRLTGSTNLTLTVAAGAATIDLRVKQIAFESGTYRVAGETGYAVTGTPVVVKALIRNDGNTASDDFVVAFLDGTNATYATCGTNVPAFSERWVTAPAGWPAEAGAHTLSVLADSTNEVDETNEGNNTRGFTVIGTAALSDLIVTGIVFDPAVPKAGDTVTITATVLNQGGTALPAGAAFDVLFSMNSGEIATETVTLLSDLAPGASVSGAATHTFPAHGAFTVSVQADSGADIAETDEANNTLASTLSVRQALPDLRPFYYLYGREGWSYYYRSGLSFSPAQPVAGEAVTVSCDLYNVGTVPLAAGEAFDVVFSVGEEPFATNRVTLASDLAVGASTRTEVVWPGGVVGVTNVSVAVDTAAEIAEENEANNGTAAGLTIYPSDAALVAASLTTSPLQPLPGGAVILTATIRNDGGEAGGAGAPVEFFAGSTNLVDKLGEASLPGDVAAKGGTQPASLAWTAPETAGPVTLYARVGGSTVQRVMTVTANPAPNLQVYSEDIAFNPPLPQSGEAVGVSSTIRNTEGTAATDFQVRFFVESSAGGQWVDLGLPVTIASLAAGSSTTVNATAAITADAERSAYSVKVEIEPNAAQGDANPGDNAATSSFLLADTPRADAGPDAACFVGQPVAFDGTGSTNAANYTWTVASAPAGSTAELTGAGTATPSLTPDLPGVYELQLVVDNGTIPSAPDTVRLTATWLTLAVTSPHGTPTPGTGLHHYAWSMSVDCQSTSVDEPTPGTQHLCIGWTGTGSVPPEGGTTNVSFAITNHSTLAWQWATNYWLEVAATVGVGQVTGGDAWVPGGTQATLTACAEDGYRFDHWRLDGQPAGGITNELVVLMDAAHTVEAVFVVLDLAEALDTTGLVWTAGGTANWFPQTVVTHDGIDAARSGAVGDGEKSWLGTTLSGSGILSFQWKTSSEADYDWLYLKVNGVIWRAVSGATEWSPVSIRLEGEGPHHLTWEYSKDKTVSEGEDCGWLDQVEWTLDPHVLEPVFDPDGGWHPDSNVTVTVTCASVEATIRYTLDGSDPTTASTAVVSGGTVQVPVPGTLKAKAWKTGFNPSATHASTYRFQHGPAWWYAYAVIDPDAESANDFAAVNAGQLKHIATQARNSMAATIGTSMEIETMVANFPTNGNYAAINIGQAKTIAKPFYDRLIETGRVSAYPWQGAPATNDHAVVNIGQIKQLFQFNLPAAP